MIKMYNTLEEDLRLELKEDGLHIEFDLAGANELKEIFKKAFEEGKGTLQVSNSYIERNKPIHVFTVTNTGDPAELTYSNGEFILELDPEVIEFCIIRFDECESKGDFFPAEICDVDYGVNNDLKFPNFNEMKFPIMNV